MTDRGKIYVYNALHALVRTSNSFSSLPTAARPYSLVSPPPGAAKWHELQQRFIYELDAVRALRAMSGSKEKPADFKVIISTHTVSKSCPAIDIAIPWADIESDYENDLTDAQGTRYKIAPEELATMGRLLQSFICSGIEPLTTRKEYSSNICGCSVIRQLLTLRDEYALLFGADFEEEYYAHRRKGLPDALAQTFLDWAEQLSYLSASCTGSRNKDASILVNAVTDAIHGLGSEVRTDIRMALRIASIAPNDLAGTIKTTALALTQMEREASRNRRSGAVKKAATDRRPGTPPPKRPNRDARKTDAGTPAAAAARPKSSDTPRPKPWNHRPWESSDGPCPFQDCKGPHWKIHCPAHPSTEAGTGMAKVAAGQVTATNNEECDTFTFDDNPTLSFHDMVGLAFPNGVEERIIKIDPSTATTTARTCVATSQTPLSAREAMLGRAPEQATEPAPIAQCHSIDVPASDDDASMDDPLAKRAADSWAPCKREECPCSASFNGLPNEFCCFTCQGGQPCTRNIHQAPVQPAEGVRPSLGTVAPCKREGCPCTSSFSGRPNEFCCFTCQRGQPCSRNIHRAPGQPPGVAPTPPPSPPIQETRKRSNLCGLPIVAVGLFF